VNFVETCRRGDLDMARAQAAKSDKKKALFELEKAKSLVAYMKKHALADVNVSDLLHRELEGAKKELSLEKNRRVSAEQTLSNSDQQLEVLKKSSKDVETCLREKEQALEACKAELQKSKLEAEALKDKLAREARDHAKSSSALVTLITRLREDKKWLIEEGMLRVWKLYAQALSMMTP
jgi:chromosome segregation ATPase